MIQLPQDLIDQGFAIADAVEADFQAYYAISRECYEIYVDEYFGGWDEQVQIDMNSNHFCEKFAQTAFKKLLLHDEVVGFYAFDELGDKIDGISIQMTQKARGKGVGRCYLEYVTAIAERDVKPIFLQVFKSNPAQNLYKRHGFVVYDESASHYLMRYNP